MQLQEPKHLVRREVQLWMGLLGPPTLWLMQLGANYGFAHPACKAGERWLLFAPSVVVIALSLVIGALLFRVRAPFSDPRVPTEDGRSARARFMANLGLVSVGWFLIMMIGTALPGLLMNPCD